MRCYDICENAAVRSRCFARHRLLGCRGVSRQVKVIQNYIAGKFVRGSCEFADVNPADGSEIAQVTEADRDLVDAAVQSARKALRGEWGRLGVRERAARL